VIPVPGGVQVWIATGHCDLRRGMRGLALQVQQRLKHDPHAGDLWEFRGRKDDLIKILWHHGIGFQSGTPPSHAKILKSGLNIGKGGRDRRRAEPQ